MPLTKRIVSGVVLLLYLYNLAGYIGLFLFIRGSIRDEVAGKIQSEISGEEYVTLIFHTRSMESGACNLRWIDDHEFRYNGKMYDIVHRDLRGDSTMFVCLVDTKEEQLYSRLEQHVSSQTDHPASSGSLNSIKNILQEFLPLQAPAETVICGDEYHASLLPDYYESVVIDILTPPPRPFLIG